MSAGRGREAGGHRPPRGRPRQTAVREAARDRWTWSAALCRTDAVSSIDARRLHRYDRGSMTEASAFSGFSADGLQFLRDLAANNDRAWFQPRKADYER